MAEENGKVKIVIDGKEVTCPRGAMLLHVARKAGIEIPTLCSHPAVAEYGACRICVVEVIDRRGRSRVTASCTYPVRDRIEVKTNSERVLRARRINLELLLARCPNNEKLREFARRLGVEGTRFKTQEEPTDCILCGLCVRVCSEVVGANAIGFHGRGSYRGVGSPFLKDVGLCTGCGACAAVCPTGAIRIEDQDGVRYVRLWNTRVELARCPGCGRYFAPDRLLRQVQERVQVVDRALLELCPECRPRAYARRLLVGKGTLKGET